MLKQFVPARRHLFHYLSGSSEDLSFDLSGLLKRNPSLCNKILDSLENRVARETQVVISQNMFNSFCDRLAFGGISIFCTRISEDQIELSCSKRYAWLKSRLRPSVPLHYVLHYSVGREFSLKASCRLDLALIEKWGISEKRYSPNQCITLHI